MKTLTSIPKHYRQLQSDEIIRKGDLYLSISNEVGDVEYSIGDIVGNWKLYKKFTFWRRCHVSSQSVKITGRMQMHYGPTVLNLRQLGKHELVIEGDYWNYTKSKPNEIIGVIFDPIKDLTAGTVAGFNYYRPMDVPKKAKVKESIPSVPNWVNNAPLVHFFYPKHNMRGVSVLREVRLVSANQEHFIGVEVSDKNKFKKFLRSKTTNVRFVEFNAQAME